MKAKGLLKNPVDREMYDKQDCVKTPSFSDFDFVAPDVESVQRILKEICDKNHFYVHLKKTTKGNKTNLDVIKFTCAKTPFLNKGSNKFAELRCSFYV